MTSDAKVDTSDWLHQQCNRLVYGQCSTRHCLVRGGYEHGTVPTYDKATCEAHEAYLLIQSLPKVTAERDRAQEEAFVALAAQGHLIIQRDALSARVKELEAGLDNLAFHSEACASRKVSDMQRELTRKSIERARALIGKEPSK